MILDTLAHADRYVPLHPLFRAGFDYLRRFSPDTPDGRHAIEGEKLFALVQSYTTAPAAEKRFETHRKYIDIQYIVSGEEALLHAPAEGLEVSVPYDAEKEAMFYRDPAISSATALRAGEFTIYFPNDAHKGACALHAPVAVRKIVLKVAV
jgi:YhcH/YjgK/YiaL family protein